MGSWSRFGLPRSTCLVFSDRILDREAEIGEWVQILKRVVARGIKAFAYANNHYAGHGPATVKLFWEIWNKKKMTP